ncbi:MAG: anti-sigma factor [Anaerolineaceae bacterium]|nr:anti-sigma factor [Anaerolineaceae bacterium]
MNKRIEEELFPFYALDALTAEEKAEVEAYVAGDPAAKARLVAFQEAAEQLPLAIDPIPPSPSVKANLMARVQADARARVAQSAPQKRGGERPSPPQLSWWERLRQSVAMPVLAGTAALAAIVLFVWAIALSQQVNQLQAQVADLTSDTNGLVEELAALRADNEQLRVRNESLQQQLEAQEDVLASYQAPGATTLALGDITGENPAAAATLTVAPEAASATFVARNLPQLSADQAYQLWIIRGDQPLSAGVFSVDENGRVTLPVDATLASSYDAVGVSIEPAGGSETPTPDQIILLGAASS